MLICISITSHCNFDFNMNKSEENTEGDKKYTQQSQVLKIRNQLVIQVFQIK